MTQAVMLERTDTGNTRLLVLESDGQGILVVDVFEADTPENIDTMWWLLGQKHPDVHHVRLDTGEFEETDCLSLREAVEAHFNV